MSKQQITTDQIADFDSKVVPNTRKINNKELSSDITLTSSDIGALPTSTKYGAAIDLSINNTTFVITAQLKDQLGNNLGAAKTIDLPLESVVVNGFYDSNTKKVILTLQNGSTIEFSVADLVSGLQPEITSNNKLSADLVSDNSTTNKFVTTSEKNTWNAKQDALTAGSGINITGSTISTVFVDNSVQINDTIISLTPVAGTTYICNNPLTSLTLNNIPTSNNEIAIYFTVHSTDEFTFTASDLIDKWWGVDEPEFEAGKTYVICISNGMAVYGKQGE